MDHLLLVSLWSCASKMSAALIIMHFPRMLHPEKPEKNHRLAVPTSGLQLGEGFIVGHE